MSPTDVPFVSVPLGKTTFQLTTSVGRSLQTYDLRRGLQLVFITRPQTPDVITATAAWRDCVFAAWGAGHQGHAGIWVFKRGKKIGELEEPPPSQEKVTQLVIFGSWIVGCGQNQIYVWKSTTLEHYTTLSPPSSRTRAGQGILSGGICSAPTFLNKIFAGRQDGGVEIWNISTA